MVEILFWAFLLTMGLQRLSELFVSRRNTLWIRERGGKEFGREHFSWVVLLVFFFFTALPVERYFFRAGVVALWPVLFGLFILAQGLRYWSMASLGRHWNVRIWVIPGARRIRRGPYRWFSHPNYLAVLVELTVVPLIFGCYRTAFMSLMGYMLFLRVRIAEEEKALQVPLQDPRDSVPLSPSKTAS